MSASYITRAGRGGWKYQRTVPVAIKPFLRGRKLWRDYHPDCSRKEAEAWGRALAARHDELIRNLVKLDPQERETLIQLGPDRAKNLAHYARSLQNPAAAESVSQPPPDPNERVAFVRANYPRSHMATWTAADHALAQIETARFMAELREQANDALAILSKADPNLPEHGFDALLKVWARSFGPEWRGATDGHYRTVALLRTFFGPARDYRTITRDDIARFRDYMETLRKSQDWQIKHLSRAAAMYAKAVSDSHETGVQFSPCKGVAVRGASAERVQGHERPFTGMQLKTILDTASRNGFGGQRRDAAMWVLRLLAYTGARPREVLQLQRGDVRTLHGVPCIILRDVCAATGERPMWTHPDTSKQFPLKTIKNEESFRTVPLHKDVAADFLEFAQGNGADFIFEVFPFNAHKGRRGWFDVEFGPFMRGPCGITDGKLSLYSMRHRFHDVMDNADIPSKRQRKIVGHAGGVHGGYGGKILRALKADIDRCEPFKD